MQLSRVAYYEGDDRYRRGWWAVIEINGREIPRYLGDGRPPPDVEILASLIETMGLRPALNAIRIGAVVVKYDGLDEESPEGLDSDGSEG